MSNDLDDDIRAALRAIPEDADAPARLVTHLAEARRPAGLLWIAGGAALAGVAGFAFAILQGPVTGPGGDAMLFILGGAL